MFVKDQEMTRYKLAPHITLGKLEDSLIGLKRKLSPKLKVTELLNLFKKFLIISRKIMGFSIKELEENFEVESDQLKHVLEF